MRKRKFSIKSKIISIALVPLVTLCGIVTFVSSTVLLNSMKSDTLDKLESIAVSVIESLNSISAGDYHVVDDKLYKGDFCLSDDLESILSITEYTGVYITITFGDVRYVTTLTGDNVIGSTISEEVSNEVLKEGNVFTSDDVTIDNERYFSCYVPVVDAEGNIVGCVFAGSPSAMILNMVDYEMKKILFCSAIVILISILTISVFTRHMYRAVVEETNLIQTLSAGDLSLDTNSTVLDRNDELGEMSNAIGNLVTSLLHIVSDIKTSSTDIGELGSTLQNTSRAIAINSDEITKAVSEVSSGATMQAAEIESATSKVVSIGEQIDDITASVENLIEIASSIKESSKEADNLMEGIIQYTNTTGKSIETIDTHVSETNEAVCRIQKAVDIITSISKQTSLLSLNASIEAARAGDSGKGFAVVASEIQKLAEGSSKSAKEITDIVNELIEAANTLSATMKEVKDTTDRQKSSIFDTKDKFSQVVSDIDTVTTRVYSIDNKTKECSEARNVIVDVISNLSAIAEENAASTQETSASMDELNDSITKLSDMAKTLLELSAVLNEDVQFFKID